MSDAEFDYSCLDPGIRAVVRTLRGAGFQTCDSGDGKSKPADWYTSGEALPYPHVFCTTTARGLFDDAIMLLQLLRAEHREMGEWQVEANWTPNDGKALLIATLAVAPAPAAAAITRAELERAIARVEHSRGTHVEWVAFIRDYPEEAAKPSPRAVSDVAGDLKHHEDCIEGYDHVLGVLRRIVPVDAKDAEGAPV